MTYHELSTYIENCISNLIMNQLLLQAQGISFVKIISTPYHSESIGWNSSHTFQVSLLRSWDTHWQVTHTYSCRIYSPANVLDTELVLEQHRLHNFLRSFQTSFSVIKYGHAKHTKCSQCFLLWNSLWLLLEAVAAESVQGTDVEILSYVQNWFTPYINCSNELQTSIFIPARVFPGDLKAGQHCMQIGTKPGILHFFQKNKIRKSRDERNPERLHSLFLHPKMNKRRSNHFFP